MVITLISPSSVSGRAHDTRRPAPVYQRVIEAAAATATVAAIALSLCGCAADPEGANVPAVPAPSAAVTLPPPAPEDAAALTQVTDAAARSAQVDGVVRATDCWSPSRHIVKAGKPVFRVICRVYYDQAGTSRYKDMTCIGDLTATPMLDHCYRWAHYSDTPGFADGPGLASPPVPTAPTEETN